MIQGRFEGKKFEDADNRDTLGGYYVVDLMLSRPISPPGFLPSLHGGQIFLAMQNLFDRTYEVDRGGGIRKTGTPLLIQGGIHLQF